MRKRIGIRVAVKVAIFFFAFWIVVLLLPAVHATTLARLSLEQLAAGSDAAARVRTVRAESRRIALGKRIDLDDHDVRCGGNF